MADTVTNEEVDAEVERVNDLRKTLADAEAARDAAIRAADSTNVLAELKLEGKRLQDAIDALDDPVPAPPKPPATPPSGPTTTPPSVQGGANAGGN